MNISEAHLAFKFGLDKIDSLNYPNFLPEEIDLLLNQGYKRWVKQRYGLNNVKRQSFEETQKRTEDLKNLVKAVNLVPLAYNSLNIDSNARFVTLPTDHWFIIQERVEVSYIDCTGVTVTDIIEVRPTQHVEFDKVVKDAFKKPDNTKVLRLMEDGQVELVSSTGITITQYRLRYLKQPVTVDLTTGVTFETSEHTHQEIVDEAIKIALEDIEAKRNSTFTSIVDNQKE
jgi:hypothetical protein